MSIHVEPFALDLARPLATAAGEIDRREGFVVRVEASGTTGVGEATPLPGWTESLSACRAALDAVAEADGGAGAALSRPGATTDGNALADAPAARHGLALAVADAQARAAGRPLADHLARQFGRAGAAARVPVNATVGDGPPDATAREAAAAVEAGFPAVKVKVGARPVEADRARLRAVRERAPAVELRADANGAWDRATAERALEALSAFDVAYVEQPLAPDDLAGHAALRRTNGTGHGCGTVDGAGPGGNGVGIALDETLSRVGVERVLSAGAADVLVCKPMVLGGPGRALSAVRRARERGVEAVVTTTVDGALARAGAVHLAAALGAVRPCGLATGDRVVDDLVPDPAPVADGRACVPDGPGLVGTSRFH